MTDIAEQLRRPLERLRDADAFVKDGINYAHLCWEAAAEIERLRAEIDQRRTRAQEFLDELAEWRAGYERLRIDLDRLLAMNIDTEKQKGKCIEEVMQLRAERDVFQKTYLEISKIVGRQGNEEQSLADQVKQLCVERDELLTGLDALASLKTLTTPRNNADLVLGPDPFKDKM